VVTGAPTRKLAHDRRLGEIRDHEAIERIIRISK
jgi:hypothetical protein